MRRAACSGALVALAGLVLAACGTPSYDDFVAYRSGSGPGAKLTLRVIDDGSVSCNGRDPVEISSAELIDARALAEDLSEPAKQGIALEPRAGSVLRYEIDVEQGTVSFADNSARAPAAFARAQALIHRLATERCRLKR